MIHDQSKHLAPKAFSLNTYKFGIIIVSISCSLSALTVFSLYARAKSTYNTYEQRPLESNARKIRPAKLIKTTTTKHKIAYKSIFSSSLGRNSGSWPLVIAKSFKPVLFLSNISKCNSSKSRFNNLAAKNHENYHITYTSKLELKSVPDLS